MANRWLAGNRFLFKDMCSEGSYDPEPWRYSSHSTYCIVQLQPRSLRQLFVWKRHFRIFRMCLRLGCWTVRLFLFLSSSNAYCYCYRFMCEQTLFTAGKQLEEWGFVDYCADGQSFVIFLVLMCVLWDFDVSLLKHLRLKKIVRGLCAAYSIDRKSVV